jgi:hypothetical protein
MILHKFIIITLTFLFFKSLNIFAQNESEKKNGFETYGRLSISPIKILYNDSQLPFTMDGSWATLNNRNGTTTFFETDMGKFPFYYRYSGSIDNPLNVPLTPFIIDYNGYNNTWPNGCWIQNIYKHADGILVGFVHREDLYPKNKNLHGNSFYYIGLASSEDNGLHWKYLGDILGTMGNRNIGGVPYLVVNGYFYVYFNEWNQNNHKQLSVARAKVNDVMNALKLNEVIPFFKYNNGSWQGDGFTGIGSSLILDSNSNYDFHSDATFCKPLGKFLITVQTHGENKLYLYFSDDGIRWVDRIILDYSPGNIHPYSSIIGFDAESSDDSHEVGSQFCIYICRKKSINYNSDVICYRTISIK